MRKNKFKKIYCEITNSCNLSCDFCPSSTTSNSEKCFMSEELFSKLIPQLQPLTYMLCLHIMGEPMLHPLLKRFLDICDDYNMNVSIVTNGTLLNEDQQQLLMHNAVKQINFSLQSFESNFPDQDNSQYLNNIFQFISKTFIKRPDLHINLRLWNGEKNNSTNRFTSLIENKRTINRIKNYFQIPDTIIDDLSKGGNRLKGDLYLNFSDRFDWPGKEIPFQSKRGRCMGLKNQFGILSDGRVVPCCLDKDGEIELGNSNNDSILDILNSNRAIVMLNGFKKGNFSETLCQHCTFNKRFS